MAKWRMRIYSPYEMKVVQGSFSNIPARTFKYVRRHAIPLGIPLAIYGYMYYYLHDAMHRRLVEERP